MYINDVILWAFTPPPPLINTNEFIQDSAIYISRFHEIIMNYKPPCPWHLLCWFSPLWMWTCLFRCPFSDNCLLHIVKLFSLLWIQYVPLDSLFENSACHILYSNICLLYECEDVFTSSCTKSCLSQSLQRCVVFLICFLCGCEYVCLAVLVLKSACRKPTVISCFLLYGCEHVC